MAKMSSASARTVDIVAHSCCQSNAALVLTPYAWEVSARRLAACFEDTAGAQLETACPIGNAVLPESIVASLRKRPVYLATSYAPDM